MKLLSDRASLRATTVRLSIYRSEISRGQCQQSNEQDTPNVGALRKRIGENMRESHRRRRRVHRFSRFLTATGIQLICDVRCRLCMGCAY